MSSRSSRVSSRTSSVNTGRQGQHLAHHRDRLPHERRLAVGEVEVLVVARPLRDATALEATASTGIRLSVAPGPGRDVEWLPVGLRPATRANRRRSARNPYTPASLSARERPAVAHHDARPEDPGTQSQREPPAPRRPSSTARTGCWVGCPRDRLLGDQAAPLPRHVRGADVVELGRHRRSASATMLRVPSTLWAGSRPRPASRYLSDAALCQIASPASSPWARSARPGVGRCPRPSAAPARRSLATAAARIALGRPAEAGASRSAGSSPGRSRTRHVTDRVGRPRAARPPARRRRTPWRR